MENCSTMVKQPLLDMPSVSGKQKIDNAVPESEIRLAAFICEYDLPIRTVEHIPKLIQALRPDSTIAKHIKYGRTKLKAKINNVTVEESFDLLIKHLQVSKFSLFVDESTYVSTTKHLCMVARTLLNNQVVDCFLGLIPLKHATARVLYDSISFFFSEKHIPYKENMIDFGANGANTELGARNFP